jgi:hypothetical protein
MICSQNKKEIRSHRESEKWGKHENFPPHTD